MDGFSEGVCRRLNEGYNKSVLADWDYVLHASGFHSRIAIVMERGEQRGTYDVSSAVSLAVRTFRTMVLAISSALSGYFWRAADNAASASGSRPRCNSATACPAIVTGEDVAGFDASSS
jgi:hypothetical protein